MATLTLGERRTHLQDSLIDSQSVDSRRQSLRLPIVEPAAGRRRSHDYDYEQSDTSPHPDPQSSRPYSNHGPKLGIPYRSSGHSSRRDSLNQSTPHSPPYNGSDTEKPRLPPITTVLGRELSSPPQTPSLNGASLQPSPREPIYTADTYKPPSLYPNKKQRTDWTFEPVPPITGVSSSHSSVGLPSASFERNTPYMSASLGSESSRYAPVDQRQRVSGTPYTTTDGSYTQPRFSPSDTLSRSNGDRIFTGRQYRTPERTPTLEASEFGSRRADASNGAYLSGDMFGTRNGHRDTYDESRRSSTTLYGDYILQSFAHGQNGAHSPRTYDHFASTSRAEPPNRTAISSFTRPDLHSSRPNQDLAQRPHDNGHANGTSPFFVPGSFEYSHIKSRKRSNLPKQSTEIMKNWFDQNITNPYPSEEQKLIFSNATGISMTQVSNWFINHRRRCPELRDKREKNRVREHEG